MALTKPAVIPEWARTGTRTEPTEGRKDSGWLVGDVPPAEVFNWIDGLTGDHLSWFNERFADGTGGPTVFAILNPNDGTRQLQTITTGGIKVDVGLNIGFDGVATSGALSVGDVNFQAKLVSSTPTILFDGSADAMSYDRTANQLDVTIASNRQLALATSVFKLGTGTVSTLPFDVASTFTGTLGDLTGNFFDIASFGHLVDDEAAMLHYGYRHADDATWSSASSYLQSKIDSAFKSFVRFSGDQVASTDYNIGTHVGLGAGARGAEASLFVDDTAAYAHAFLPRTYYGLAGSLSEIGSQTRPWSTIWMRDTTGTDAHINATGSGGPGTLTLESMEGATSRGVVKLIGNATLASSRVDCTGIGYIDALEVRARIGDPLSSRGFGLTSGVGLPLYSGLFGSPDGEGVRLWRKNNRAIEIIGRSTFDADVQLTLGTGTGASAGDLRQYSCIAHNYLAGGSIDRGDLVLVSSAAAHTVLRTTSGSALGVIGVALDSVVVGQILRVATSGIVLARTEGNPVAQGDFIVSSATADGRSQSGSFGPAVVGVALESVGASTYFKMQIRFGG